jgi:hypothetical protein
MGDHIEQRVLVGLAHVVDPFLGNAERHQLGFPQVAERLRSDRRGPLRRRDDDLLHALAHLDKLHCASCRVSLDLAPLSPFVGVIMMGDVGKEQARRRAVDDEPNVGVDAHRPEVRVPGAVELVKGKSWRGWVHLQIEGRRFGGLLFLRSKARQAVCETVSDEEVHCLPPLGEIIPFASCLFTSAAARPTMSRTRPDWKALKNAPSENRSSRMIAVSILASCLGVARSSATPPFPSDFASFEAIHFGQSKSGMTQPWS